MKQDIIAHLKSMLSTQNPYYREVAYQTLQGLSKNVENLQEIMRDVDFDDIADDMNINQEGNEELLDHSDYRFRDYAISAIYDLLLVGARQTKAI
ncbi:MAG: hypothetical protein EZS28_052994, partial [Streblomastix strix]